MRILITGGCGFIGTNVSLEAKRRGHEVIAMDSFIRKHSERNIEVLTKAGVEILRGDVRNVVDLQRSPIPDAIIHLAANPGIPWSITWPKYDFEVNTIGTINILEYSRIMSEQVGHKIPVIFASTNKVYSDIVNEIPLIEKDKRYVYENKERFMTLEKKEIGPENKEVKVLVDIGLEIVWWRGWSNNGINEYFPIDGYGRYSHSPYGASKLAADQYVQEYGSTFGVPIVINRMSCVYGLYQKGVEDQGWIDWFVRQVAFGDGRLNFYGDGKQVRDMLFGDDVARLYIDELENIDEVKGNVFNIGGGKDNTLSLNESIEIIEKISHKKAKITYSPWRHADQKVYINDISKIQEVLGWKPKISPKEGIERMIKFYRKNKNEVL
jgi:CDP-paratose 2-epimerase